MQNAAQNERRVPVAPTPREREQTNFVTLAGPCSGGKSDDARDEGRLTFDSRYAIRDFDAGRDCNFELYPLGFSVREDCSLDYPWDLGLEKSSWVELGWVRHEEGWGPLLSFFRITITITTATAVWVLAFLPSCCLDVVAFLLSGRSWLITRERGSFCVFAFSLDDSS